MKTLLTCMLSLITAAAASAQNLPDAPIQAPPDPAWTHLQTLAVGSPIVVSSTNGPPVHCQFTNVTDAYLFCAPPGNPAGVGFRFDRASVLSVEPEVWVPAQVHQRSAQRSSHPVWIASIIAGGIIVGFCATRTTDAGHAAQDGLIGAAAVAVIGAPLAFLPHPDLDLPPYPRYPPGTPFAMVVRTHPHLHFPARR